MSFRRTRCAHVRQWHVWRPRLPSGGAVDRWMFMRLKKKGTAARSRISSKLVFASCVCCCHRGYYGVYAASCRACSPYTGKAQSKAAEFKEWVHQHLRNQQGFGRCTWRATSDTPLPPPLYIEGSASSIGRSPPSLGFQPCRAMLTALFL